MKHFKAMVGGGNGHGEMRWKRKSDNKMRDLLTNVRNLAFDANDLHRHGQQMEALAVHAKLQHIAMRTLAEESFYDKIDRKEEISLRFIIADSAFRIGMIYEDTYDDLDNAIKEYINSLHHYRNLRLDLSGKGFFDTGGGAVNRALVENSQLLNSLCQKLLAIFSRISNIYMEQENYNFALQVCHDALDVLGVNYHETDTRSRRNATSKMTQDMAALYHQFADTMEEIRRLQATETQAGNTSGKRGEINAAKFGNRSMESDLYDDSTYNTYGDFSFEEESNGNTTALQNLTDKFNYLLDSGDLSCMIREHDK